MDNEISSECLVQMSSDDDSDVDEVTDYLSATNNNNNKDGDKQQIINNITNNNNKDNKIIEDNNNKLIKSTQVTAVATIIPGGIVSSTTTIIPSTVIVTPTNYNMVPIISVTPHSPGAKYSSILEDTLNQLQCIRETVVQMKNSSVQNTILGSSGLINPTLSSSRLFSSCPSLPDLTTINMNNNNMWPQPNVMCGLNSDRRKSWTAIEDLTECAKNSHKSVSLSSLDSEEQESLRTAERIHNRTSRNSTGGISTHSLNEAELARDFERIAAKRNLAPTVCRIPLQKSISTPSIAPLRNQNAKEDNNIPTSRHLSDSEDDNQDDRSLLCVHDKIEVYADHPEKRRKRGSLFFRKKKDKTKTKGQSTNCDGCGAVINLSTYKDHAVECKAKLSKNQQVKSGSGKKNSSASHGTPHSEDQGRDYYDGHSHNDNPNYADDTPLIRDEFLSEPPIGPQDLGAEPILGVAIDEYDSWSPSVPKEIVKSLKDKQVKRQEHIYEFIMTEKHHCQTLLVMQKVFVESLQRHFNHLNLERMFPRLPELTELHTGFLKKLRMKQRENNIVDSIADILLDFFSSMSAQRLKSAYGEFCSNHRSALDTFKCYMTEDQTFSEWYKHCQTNPILKKKGIPECILFVTQRLTKYPLLIDPLLKSSREDKIEQEKLQKAMSLVKEILVDVDARVADKEKEDRQLEIFKRIDAKSCATFKKNKFKKSDIISSNRKLKFEGVATLMQGRSKMQSVFVVVLTDCLFFLQENSHKYTFFTPENKAGVVSLQKLLIREKAGTESRGIYIISSNPAYPEMYELKVQNPKDKNIWIQAIRAAVVVCPSDESEFDDFMTIEQKQKLIDAKQANIREIIYKMRQKDLEQALLLEQKITLQLSLLVESQNSPESIPMGPGIEAILSSFGSYRDIVTDGCDTVEVWKRVLYTIQEISVLASTLYTAATGLPLSRSQSSVGEKQSDAYISPTLPKRAETFGGFDERRNKSCSPWRDAVLSTLPTGMMSKDNHHHYHHHLHHHHDKRDSIASNDNDSNILPTHLAQNSTKSSSESIALKDSNYAALQVSHHLHTLLCIISQQMTTIQSLQAQIMAFRDNPKSIYRHNDQLEELRNLQDKLQEEKQAWLKQKEQQEKELDERRKEQQKFQNQIRAEQDDIKHQREQLYRKMEFLSNQGLLLSPNTPLPLPVTASTSMSPIDDSSHGHSSEEHYTDGSGAIVSDRRKDKWKTTNVPKTPPVNLLSATNAPKINQSSVKQQLPLKLSSLSSTKSDKNLTALTSPNNAGGITQMFPLKLADKKNQTLIPNHSRTGSSPAIIQQQTTPTSGNPATRTNTYPKLPERYRLRSADGVQQMQNQQPIMPQPRSISLHSQLPTHLSTSSSTNLNQQQQQQQQNRNSDNKNDSQEEEVIYF